MTNGEEIARLRESNAELTACLTDAMNWWEPRCHCNKGAHRDEWEQYMKARAALRKAGVEP